MIEAIIWYPFPKEKEPIWEDFITKHLEIDYWNEYIADNCVVFLFHLQEGIKRYEVNNLENEEVLALCENIINQVNVKSMLMGDHFYKEKLNNLINPNCRGNLLRISLETTNKQFCSKDVTNLNLTRSINYKKSKIFYSLGGFV